MLRHVASCCTRGLSGVACDCRLINVVISRLWGRVVCMAMPDAGWCQLAATPRAVSLCPIVFGVFLRAKQDEESSQSCA